MGFYNKIFSNSIKIAGSSKGAKPAFLMPPDGTFVKVGFQIYEALDLICEGPIAGLTDQRGRFLGDPDVKNGLRARKDFNKENNVIGSSTGGVDKGIYFDDDPLRNEQNSANIGKYDVSLKVGDEFQNAPLFGASPQKLNLIAVPIKGPYKMGVGGRAGARNGTGSRDVRTEGTDARDFVNWQNFVPRERAERPYRYVNYDSNITKLLITLQVDALQDTKSFSTKEENEAGRSKMGTPLPLTVSVRVQVGKVDKNGTETIQFAKNMTTRGGNSVSVGRSTGRLSVTGVVTNPYTVSLEGIELPTLTETDLYSFVKISKEQFETISNLVKRDISVKSITEFTDETFLYPNSCTVATSIDARYYPSVPERTFRLKGKKVLIPSNYTPIDSLGVDRRFSNDKSTRGNVIYDGPWDGTFKFGWTDNPAWIYYDLLISTRYGIGSYIRDTNIIDKWSLFEIGQYCDAVTLNDGSRTTRASGAGAFIGLDDGLGGLEPRFSCNIMFKDQTNAVDALQSLARSFRALSFYNNSTMSVRVDRPYFISDFIRTENFETEISLSTMNSTEFIPPKELKFPPHLIFNNENVLDGFFSYSDVDRTQKLSALEVSFLDKRSNYTQKTEYVEDPELIKQFGLNVQSIEGIGITSRSQANRLAKFALFESANSNETVNFNVGFEGLLLTPGDIIQVNDELKDFTKSYGTVLTTSGEEMYYDPDATGKNVKNTNDEAIIESGLGPKAILVQPAIGTSQLDNLTEGNIHLYNPIGKSGSNEFYSVPTSPNSGYRDIHQAQVISLKLKHGGSGFTYKEVDDGVLFNLDTQAIFQGIGESSDATVASQWFSKKQTNLIAGSQYSIDVSGVNSKYYRVLNVSEDENNGYAVSAVIHHTGKFRFVEENISFDIDSDTAQPDLKLTQVAKPNPPSGITSGTLSQNVDGSLNFPIEIHQATSSPGDRYVVILEEPNKNLVTSIVNKSNAGKVTNFTLEGVSKLDQIGEYELNVFSESTFPILSRSTIPVTVSFTTNAEDFGLNTSTDSFIEYKNISMLTDTNFTTSYNENDDIGTGQNSFFENDSGINATIQVDFKDIFGGSGNSILQSVTEQRVDILDSTGAIVARNFKKLGQDTEFIITNTGLEAAFGFNADNPDSLFTVPKGFKFQAGFFTLSGLANINADDQGPTLVDPTGTFINFETPNDFYDKPPMVFIQQVVSGRSTGVNGSIIRERPLGRMSISTNGFRVSNTNLHPTKYVYFASPTGVFKFDGQKKVIQVGSGNMEANIASFQTGQFLDSFDSVPKVFVQLQSTGKDHDKDGRYCTTSTSGNAVSEFSFGAFNESGKPFLSTGIFGYIASDVATFNTLLSSNASINCINISTDRVSIKPADQALYTMTGINATQVLTDFNDENRRFTSNEQILLVQNTGALHTGEHFVVNRLATGNIITSHSMATGMSKVSGYRTLGNTTGNKISLNYTGGGTTPVLNGNIHIATMVNVPPTTTNQMFILDNVLTGSLLDANANENSNISGFAFFLSGSPDLHTYLYLDGADYKLSNTKINDGENHFIEAHINRDSAGQDEIVGYVDGSSGVSAHSFNQDPLVNYHFGSMCLFNNSGRHGQGNVGDANFPSSFAFNNGNIIDAIGIITGRNRFQELDHLSSPLEIQGSLYKAEYKTGLHQFIAFHETGTRTYMLTKFTGNVFENGRPDRGFEAIQHGSFEKSDIIVDRSGVFSFDFIQIGATGI